MVFLVNNGAVAAADGAGVVMLLEQQFRILFGTADGGGAVNFQPFAHIHIPFNNGQVSTGGRLPFNAFGEAVNLVIDGLAHGFHRASVAGEHHGNHRHSQHHNTDRQEDS